MGTKNWTAVEKSTLKIVNCRDVMVGLIKDFVDRAGKKVVNEGSTMKQIRGLVLGEVGNWRRAKGVLVA